MTAMLKGQVVKLVRRHRKKEVLIEFVGGTRLYVDWQADQSLEFSITSPDKELDKIQE